ncbi:MAG: hypothetical protein ACE5KT_11860 [Methanosarcinales archaeon]
MSNIFDPSDFLNIAKWLIRNVDNVSDKEALFRTSVSRSYYAAFLKSKKYLEERGFTIPMDKDAHKETIKKIREYIDRPTGDKLDELRRKRNASDYGT